MNNKDLKGESKGVKGALYSLKVLGAAAIFAVGTYVGSVIAKPSIDESIDIALGSSPAAVAEVVSDTYQNSPKGFQAMKKGLANMQYVFGAVEKGNNSGPKQKPGNISLDDVTLAQRNGTIVIGYRPEGQVGQAQRYALKSVNSGNGLEPRLQRLDTGLAMMQPNLTSRIDGPTGSSRQTSSGLPNYAQPVGVAQIGAGQVGQAAPNNAGPTASYAEAGSSVQAPAVPTGEVLK